jgi:DNA-binding CsgD family transcriptional regulator/tetratricopeptide (TPR) repeat protein
MTAGGGFVGRAAELEVLGHAVAAARAATPSVALIGGEAGMGKSTLVSETARRTSSRLLVGRCLQLGGEVVPLGPLVDLLRHLHRAAPDALAATEGLERFAPWLPAGGDWPPATARPSAEGVFAPVLELLGRLADDDAAIVVFEDLHWADHTTWDLFELLARNLFDEHLVLVGTFRSDEAAKDPVMRRRVAELRRLAWAHRIDLDGLGRDDVAARVTHLCGGNADAAFVDSIVERGEGNPFFTEELVRAHLGGGDVPDVLSDLIAADLHALGPDARSVVDTAAAVGREVAHELLAVVLGVDDGELERTVRPALDAQILLVDRDVDGYRFRHALIAEVVYDQLLPSQRRRLHRRIADAIGLDDGVSSSADRKGQLAFHLDRAGDVAGAFTALLAAADDAQAVAPAVALRQLERAFELWDDAGTVSSAEHRCDRLWQAAELATGTAGNARAVEIAREAFRWGVPERGAAWAHERLGRYLWASGQIEASREEFRAAAELVANDGNADGVAATMAGLAQAALMDADAARAERWCAEVFARVPTPADDVAAWVMATRVLAAARADRGDMGAAVALGRRAMAAAPNAYARAMAAAYLAVVLIEAGDHREAVSVAIDGGDDARLAGLDRSFGAYFDSEAAEALVRSGRWDDADSVIARRFAAGIDAFHPGRTRMLLATALLAARRGDAARAVALLDDAASGPVDRFHAPLIAAGVAEVRLALGHWEAAAVGAGRGWEATVGVRPWWAVRFAMLSACATVEHALDELARKSPVDVGAVRSRLERQVDDALAGVPELGDAAASLDVQIRHARAMASVLTGSDPAVWCDVAALWEQLPERWMAGDARLREAEASFATGDAARSASALRAAHVIALELSSEPLLARVEAMSRRTRISVESAELVVVDERTADRLGLTPREAEVLGLVAVGRTNRQIGEALYVSEKTASVHVSNIIRKLGVSTRVEAAAVAQRLGLG